MLWARARRKVLVVSGGTPVPGLHPAFLREADIELLDLASAELTPERVARERPRLVIEDVATLDAEPLGRCRALKSAPETCGVPVVLIADATLTEAARSSGAEAVIAKPIVQRAYFEAVSGFLALPRRRALRRAVNLRVSYSHGSIGGQAFTRDLSPYGAFLKTDRVLAEGTRVEIRFCIPGEVDEIRCSAVVRQTSPYEPQSRQLAGFGIEFEGMSDDDIARLERVFRRHQRAPLFSG